MHWNKPVVKCGLTIAVSLTIIFGVGGPAALQAAHPEYYMILIGVPISMSIFYAVNYLLDAVAAAKAARNQEDGNDGAR